MTSNFPSSTYSKTTTPSRFGCRMMGLYGVSSDEAQQLLVEDERSHKKQSETSPEGLFPHKGMSNILPGHFLNPLARKEAHANDNGWGAVIMNHGERQEHKGILSAIKDDTFDRVAKQVDSTQDAMFHIRAATMGAANTTENNHPFTLGNYTFMHNGTAANRTFSSLVTNRIRQQLPEVSLNANDTDSKRIFYYAVANLKKEFGSLDASEIETMPMMKNIAQSFRYIGENQTPRFFHQTQDIPIKGVINYADNNFVMSDGNRTFIYKHRHPLYLSYEQHDNGVVKNVIVASEPPPLKNRRWIELRDDHLYLIEKQSANHYQLVMYPVAQLAPTRMEKLQRWVEKTKTTLSLQKETKTLL